MALQHHQGDVRAEPNALRRPPRIARTSWWLYLAHDIKTPLTSIINYVDILKRENFQDPKIQNYLNILEMKAQRLKTLTEDVVEASKVSSGNIKLEFMTLNLVELIYQVEGEYEEKFEARNIKVILNMPDEPVTVRVDGRRMWRVLPIYFNNAAKYAMEGSRVYADLMLQPGTAKFILKKCFGSAAEYFSR